jgi:hypothetical protein
MSATQSHLRFSRLIHVQGKPTDWRPIKSLGFHLSFSVFHTRPGRVRPWRQAHLWYESF